MPLTAQTSPIRLGDFDADGIATASDLGVIANHISGAQRLSSEMSVFADLNQDGIVNDLDAEFMTQAILGNVELPGLPLARVIDTSPVHGAQHVSVTRETILRFSQPLSDTTRITTREFYAEFGGRRLLARAELSPDRRKATLFYQEPLPGSARIRVTFDGTAYKDFLERAIDPDDDGEPGGITRIEFDTLSQTPFPGTIVCGRVFASQLATNLPGGTNLSVNAPLRGVTVFADGLEEQVRAVTDSFGNFRLTNAPGGLFFVHIDGRTLTDVAAGIRWPDLRYYPVVGKQWESLPGGETNIGEVFLPLVTEGTLQTVSATNDTLITFPASVLATYPELAGVAVSIPAGALFSDDGRRGGRVGIAPVPPDRLPGALPHGLNFPLVITLQTDGPGNFGQPVPVCFPNLTNAITATPPLPPGAKSALWSFNHDTGQWEIVGPMTVSDDGRLICSDPGIGILAPGWHGASPGSPGGGGREGPTRQCQDTKACGCPAGQCCAKGSYPPLDPAGTNPVLLHSGEKQEQVIDLRIPGVGMDFIWARTYSSVHGPNTAQGNGWDFSYNLSAKTTGSSIEVRNGATRNDTFRPIPGSLGKYLRLGFFDDLTRGTNGVVTITHSDLKKTAYLPSNDPPAGGKVESVTDRNGNTMRFEYDPQGRLTNIIDTLDRNIRVAYNPQGFIESVTDFAGRSVRYSYYGENEPGGSFGDLKSVTTPTVAGTPNGNDFPGGKTTAYTYSKGFADERLNHNLLTITDGRGSNYLVNVYSTSTDPANPTYDKVVRQIRGGNAIAFTYLSQSPAAGNNNATLKVIVSDRARNVTEHFFDAGSRLVLLREFTGRAPDREAPTTDAANRPVGRLRPSDPDYFETRYEFNADFLPVRIVHPGGNITEYVYEPDFQDITQAAGRVLGSILLVEPRKRGNLREIRRLPGTHQPAGDQAVLSEKFEYDTELGCASCGGFNFVTKHTDARGHVTHSQYDSRGNLTNRIHRIPSITEQWEYNARGQMTRHVLPDNGSGHRRVDVYRYYESGSQRGHLREHVVDSGGLNLTTAYEYDSVGNVTKRTDPRGHATEFAVNALNQVVRETSPEVLPGSDVRTITDYFYDANNNLIRREIQNRRELLLAGGAPFVSAVGAQLGFHAADGGAVADNPTWTTAYEYEVLNHVTRKSEEFEPGRFIVTEYGYDENRNRTLVRYGEASAGRQTNNVTLTLYDERNLPFRETRGAGDAAQSTTQFDYDGNRNRVRVHDGLEAGAHVASHLFDGFDRLVSMTDAMGNVTTNNFDASGNLTRTAVFGELDDVRGGANNVRLSETFFAFDDENRLIREDRAFFNATNQAAIADGVATTITVYSDHSQVLATTNDNLHASLTFYDTVGRPYLRVDAKGNQMVHTFDANGNVTRVTEIEKSDLGTPDESFITAYAYDNLNRLTATTDGSGNVSRFGYDSRHNRTLTVDALTNVVRVTYDGLSRERDTIREMVDRIGVPPVKNAISTRQIWDDSSRLVAQVDDNNHATTYLYDALNRKFATAYADGTGQTNLLDAHGNAVLFTDANGNLVTNRFDDLDRLTRRDVKPGPGVSPDTTYEDYSYDGLSRLVFAADNDSTVARAYDSLGHILLDVQGTNIVASVFDGAWNQTQLIYPGGRVITNSFDALERKKRITGASGLIAEYFYVGPNRVTRRDYGNGTRCDYAYDGMAGATNAPGDFGFKHPTRTKHFRVSDGGVIDDRTYAWDRSGNKTRQQDAAVRRDYEYDSAYRLVRSTRSDSGTITYTLDGAQNRLAVTGGPDAGSYTLDATLPEPADAQLNQYTTTPFGTQQHDKNGNFASSQSTGGNRTLAYDFRNRLTRLTALGTNAVFAYDVLNRRTATLANGVTTRFLYDGWRTVEEQTSTGTATYAHGLYLDEILHMRRGTNAWFYHADDLYSVRALTTASGQVAEMVDYSDYGEPVVIGSVGNPYLFTGHRFDNYSGMYYAKNRYLDAKKGRFVGHDLFGAWHDALNFGDALTYAGNTPISQTDPLGLAAGFWGNAWEWVIGHGGINSYGSDSPYSQQMKQSLVALKLRMFFEQKNIGKRCNEWEGVSNFSGSFSTSEFVGDLGNGTAHFVGSARGDVIIKHVDHTSCKVTARMWLTNVTSLTSALYGLYPNKWNVTMDGMPFANWTQTYDWEEVFSCDCCP